MFCQKCGTQTPDAITACLCCRVLTAVHKPVAITADIKLKRLLSLFCLILALGGQTTNAQQPAPANHGVVKLSTEEFQTLDAWELDAVTMDLISPTGGSVVFSSTSDKLAYIKGNAPEIVILSLPELKQEKVFSLGGQNRLAWSPDNSRIISVDEAGKATILEIASGKQIQLPDVVFYQTEYAIYWLTDNKISTTQRTLDLNTLKFDYSIDNIYAALISSTHPKVYLGYGPDIRMTSELYIISRTRNYKTLVTKEAPFGLEFSWSHNSRYVAIQRHVSPNNGLFLCTIGKREHPGIDFTLGSFRGIDDPVTIFATALSKGKQITGAIFSPKVNPLNDQVVGAIGNCKAEGVISARGSQLIFSITTERAPVNKGDIVNNFKWSAPGMAGDFEQEKSGNSLGIWAVLGEQTDSPYKSAASSNTDWNSLSFDEVKRRAEANDTAAQIALGVRYANGLGTTKDDAEAVKWFRMVADQGDAVAQSNLGVMYAIGRGIPKDDAEAVKWYRKAAEQGNAIAQGNLGWMYANGCGIAKDCSEAVNWLTKSADQGDASGQNTLGSMYESGCGVAKDVSIAMIYYHKAAEQGLAQAKANLARLESADSAPVKNTEVTTPAKPTVNRNIDWNTLPVEEVRRRAEANDPAAQCQLGYLYDTGRGVPKDEVEAAKWYRKAAEQGYAVAQNNFGLACQNGRGVAKDDTEAVKWFRKAAEQGNARAQFALGWAYKNGRGVNKDDTEAVKWYRRAAEQGFASAQLNLGACYGTGQGVAKDEAEAVNWYRKAAEQGIAAAQSALGFRYKSGSGVPKDEVESANWFRKAAEGYRKAAEQGNAQAQVDLGSMYSSGRGVVKDKSEAEKWYRMAVNQGNTTAFYSLADLLTEQGNNLQEAQALAERAIQLQPTAYGQSTLAWVMYKQGKYSEALDHHLKAIELNITPSPLLQDRLGDIYKALGRIDEARTAWQKSLSLKASDDVQKKLSALDSH